MIQNQVYSRYLYQTLMEFGMVSVPSMGTFSLVNSEAEFIESKTKLSPPSTKISFSRTQNPNFVLSDLLNESGLDKEQSRSIQNEIQRDYSSSQSQNIPFSFEGLGTIVNDFFIEKNAGTFNRFRGLESLNIAPVQFVNKQFVPVIATDTFLEIKTPKKSKSNSFILPAIISLFTIFIIGFWIYSQLDSNSTNVKTLDTSDTTIEEQKSPSDQPFNDTMLGASDAFDSSATIDKVNEGDTVLLNKPTEVLVNPKEMEECVVVVGSFRSETNVKKMLKKISKKGYRVFTQEYNGLSRVGIAYDCAHNDPEIFKTKIKTQFNKDAWNLSDTLKK